MGKRKNPVPAKHQAGRARAVKMYHMTPCERCGNPGMDRHHKDSNPLNNDPSNVERLCRKCHIDAEDRCAPMRAARQKWDGPCSNCNERKAVWDGLCNLCHTYKDRTGKDRPSHLFNGGYHHKKGERS